MTKNYKITFNMSSPVAFSQPIMFDGIVAYAYAQETLPKQERGIGLLDIENMLDFSDMPITKHSDGYHMASWMLYDGLVAARQIHTMLKKWEESHDGMADFGSASRTVWIDRGEFKTTQIPIQNVQVPQVWFFFQSDNINEVKRLIDRHVAGIGKKVSRGYGFFRNFVVEELQENPFDSEILRPVPIKQEEIPAEWKVAYTAYTMPYWSPSNFAVCRVG